MPTTPGDDTLIYLRDGSAVTETGFGASGMDVVDVTALNIGLFETLLPLLGETGSNTLLETWLGGVPTRLTLAGVSLASLGADDFVFAAPRNDTLTGTGQRDDLFGGGGADLIDGLAGPDRLFGGDGPDVLIGGAGLDQLIGGRGDDILRGGANGDMLDGGAGIDLLDYSDSFEFVTIDLAAGSANRGTATGDVFTNMEGVIGSRFDDMLTGDDGDNHFSGGTGNDRIEAGAGDDFIDGGGGDDTLIALEGTNVLHGRAGDDSLLFSSDNSVAPARGYGGTGNDRVLGTVSSSGRQEAYELFGQGGDDVVGGGQDNDFLYGGAGNDTIVGILGSDTLYGQGNNDTLFGGSGDDMLHGGPGSDTLLGERGEDTLYGGAASDLLIGGQGTDRLYGGSGADRFWFAWNIVREAQGLGGREFSDTDIIADFEDDIDLIYIEDSLWRRQLGVLTAQEMLDTFGSQNGTDVELNFGAVPDFGGQEQILIIENTTLADVVDDFRIV